jgi:AraC-like DNA-binding protein
VVLDIERLRELVIRHGRGRTPTVLPGVQVIRYDNESRSLSGGVVHPSLAVVVQGRKETALNGRAYRYGPGEFLIVTVDLPVVGRVMAASGDEPFLAVVLELRPAEIAALLLETGSSATRPAPAEPGIAVSAASGELLDAVTRLVALLDSPGDAVALAPGLRREVLWRLLTGPQAELIRQLGTPDSRLAQVAGAIRWIQAHYAEPIRVDDLAARSALSASSFHRHFRAVTSMTPIQFQKQIRLQEARALLMTSPARVAEIGYLVGYESPSQFSREYRRTFGAPPGQDAGRLQAEIAFHRQVGGSLQRLQGDGPWSLTGRHRSPCSWISRTSSSARSRNCLNRRIRPRTRR